jgi:hypothetical protein
MALLIAKGLDLGRTSLDAAGRFTQAAALTADYPWSLALATAIAATAIV